MHVLMSLARRSGSGQQIERRLEIRLGTDGHHHAESRRGIGDALDSAI